MSSINQSTMTSGRSGILSTKYFLLFVGLILLVDQVTKLWFHFSFDYHQSVAIFPGLNFTLAYNKGAAFSFLSEQSGWQRWFFVSLAIVVTIVMWRLRREYLHSNIAQWGLLLIIAGAIGNVIDRIWLGKVIDFVHVYAFWMEVPKHFPIFNIADTAITIGALLLLWQMLVLDRKNTETTSTTKSK